MKGYITFKHGLKHMAGALAMLSGMVGKRSSATQVVVLMYHRISDTGCYDSNVDAWNVTPRRFERHMSWLARNAECLTLAQIQPRLARPPSGKPVVVVTFDDGYGNFATQALPLLERHRIPAAVFLVSRYVGSKEPFLFDCWARRNVGRASNESWLPLTWNQAEQCLQSGLVTFGSHSETHAHSCTLQNADFTAEAVRSKEALRVRLGDEHAWAYAFPYGSTRLGDVNRVYIDAVRQAGFSLGFTSDPGTVRAGDDLLMLPRVEVHGWDGEGILAAKARGALWPFRLAERLRRPKHTQIEFGSLAPESQLQLMMGRRT